MTRHSVIAGFRDADPAVRNWAFEILVSAYWKPVYKYLRFRWKLTPEDAEDLCQAFFARALEKNDFDGFDAKKARFRTFMRACVDHFVANDRKAASRLKRGGGQRLLSLDFQGAEGEFQGQNIPDSFDMEVYFRREFVRHLFAEAVDRVKREFVDCGKGTQFRVFERYDLEGQDGDEKPSYATVAQELGLTVGQVTNYLFAVRRAFRAVVLERLRAATSSEEEWRAEAREILGVSPPP